MSKAKNAPIEGEVTRQVDFNLKKEDLMLLILEGRKEVMEEQIGVLQTKSSTLRSALSKANEEIRKKVHALVLKNMNTAARNLAKGFAADKESEEENAFHVDLHETSFHVGYVRYKSVPISGSSGTYIKTQSDDSIPVRYFDSVAVKMRISLQGRVFANKSKMFYHKDAVKPCQEYGQSFTILADTLCSEFQKELSEFKAAEKIAQELAQNESLLSDIISEYDLFNRNQPRAKAKMIKEVLQRDEGGQALLNDIYAAAKGVKLLSQPQK